MRLENGWVGQRDLEGKGVVTRRGGLLMGNIGRVKISKGEAKAGSW